MAGKFLKFTGLLICFFIITGISAFITIHYLIKNQPVAVVPDIRGKEINSVVNQLETLFLTPRIKKSSFSNKIPVNHIISQEPEPGEIVKKGRDIHLVLSKGKKSNTMPFLKNLIFDDAKLEILKNGLKLDHVSYVHSSSVAKGEIIASSPQEGISVKSGTKVSLLISLGKRPVQYLMPDLKGMTIENAAREIKSKKLKILSIKTKTNDKFPFGTIISQSPKPGLKVDEGEKVALVLNQKNSPSIISPVIGTRLVSYKLPWGILRSHIKAEMEIYGKTFTLYDNYFPPMEEIDILVPFDQEAEVRIYKDGILVLEKSLLPFKDIETNQQNLFENYYLKTE